jgi:DNA polymerase epsilon subunit 1
MLRNLYRWLAAGQSALASAPLLAAVRSAMRKVVLQLVAEAGKLGATVVAADFSSVIIATGKHDLASAVGWAQLWRRCFVKGCVSLGS